jgi:hypothetical protein
MGLSSLLEMREAVWERREDLPGMREQLSDRKDTLW